MVVMGDFQHEVINLCGWTLPTPKSSWPLVLLGLLSELPKLKGVWLLILQGPLKKHLFWEPSWLLTLTTPGLVLLFLTHLSPQLASELPWRLPRPA